MTAYTSINNSEIAVDEPVTTGLMTKIRDNPIAITEGSTGAPKIQEAALDSGIVSQGKLQTTTQTITKAAGSVSPETWAYSSDTIFTEPNYSIGCRYYKTANPVSNDHSALFEDYRSHKTNTPGARYGRVGVYNESVSSSVNLQGDAVITYITSSPPYDLGDGEVPLFIFLHIKNGIIDTVSTSIDPPWAHNGPTSTKPDRIEGIGGLKRKYKTIYIPDESTGAIKTHEVEIDTVYKNKDMPIVPHPFILNNNESVILLDPVETNYFLELQNAGENINSLIINDYIRLDNTPITRNAPPGVIASRFKWKNTVRRAGEALEDRRLKRGSFSGD
jgi:hypothetical protein